MKRIALALLTLASSTHASTYYVRTDGGTPTQCSGLVNAAYSGNILNRSCAWANPLWVFPPNIDGGDPANKPLIAGGDTLIIGQGSYQMGMPLNLGNWSSCNVNWQYDCHAQPVPSGTAATPTRIMGANYANCSGGISAPQLWGSGGSGSVLNLTGSSNVLVECLEITDHSNCIKNHPVSTIKCVSGTGAWASNGLINTDGKADDIRSTNITLNDVYVHGMAQYGALVGNVSNLVVSNSRFIANGLGGWSTDLAPARSESNGVNTFTNVEIAYNGCTENYPAVTIYGCWGQETGGYGDGFGSASSSQPGSAWISATDPATDGDKGSWTFTNVLAHDNTQDGLDFLHADQAAVVTYDHVDSERNAGNQLKASGTATVTNSTVNAACSAFVGQGSMVGNNSAGGQTSGDNCRAGGDAIVFSLNPGRTMTMQHNTVLSQGNCILTIADISGTTKSTGDATSKVIVKDNALIGLPGWDFAPTVKQSCLYYWNASTTGQYVANLLMTNNVSWNTNGAPPSGNTVADPLLTNETLAGFNPTPLSNSPLLGKASDGTNIGAIQNGGVVTPPPVNPPPTICPAVCVPKVVCTQGIVSAATCSAVCQ